MPSLQGRVAVVTGASNKNGIGRAIARRFAQEGASLYLTAEATEAQLQDAVAECRDLSPLRESRHEYGIHDLARDGAAEEMIARAADLLGRIDILVNNAGVRA